MIGRSRKMGSWVPRLAVAAGLVVMAATQAHALTVDGIPLPGGVTFVTQTIFEDKITAPGQTLRGVFRITEIDDGGGNQVWVQGQGGLFLTGTFSGFVATTVIPPTPTVAGHIEFSGGTTSVYVQNSSPNISSQGNTNADFAAAQSGTLFLSASADIFPSDLGTPTTLQAVIPAAADLNAFSNAFGSAFFDVTGGDAAGAFHTCSFSVTTPGNTCPPNHADLLFSETFSTVATGDWAVSGTGLVKAVIPEPFSLGLLGSALVAFGGMLAWRRRPKA